MRALRRVWVRGQGLVLERLEASNNGEHGTKRRAAPQGRQRAWASAAPYGAKAKQRGRAAPGA